MKKSMPILIILLALSFFTVSCAPKGEVVEQSPVLSGANAFDIASDFNTTYDITFKETPEGLEGEITKDEYHFVMKITIFSLDNYVEAVQCTVRNTSPEGISNFQVISAEVFGYLASSPFDGNDPKKARAWAERTAQTLSPGQEAVETFGAVKYTMKATENEQSLLAEPSQMEPK